MIFFATWKIKKNFQLGFFCEPKIKNLQKKVLRPFIVTKTKGTKKKGKSIQLHKGKMKISVDFLLFDFFFILFGFVRSSLCVFFFLPFVHQKKTFFFLILFILNFFFFFLFFFYWDSHNDVMAYVEYQINRFCLVVYGKTEKPGEEQDTTKKQIFVFIDICSCVFFALGFSVLIILSKEKFLYFFIGIPIMMWWRTWGIR